MAEQGHVNEFAGGLKPEERLKKAGIPAESHYVSLGTMPTYNDYTSASAALLEQAARREFTHSGFGEFRTESRVYYCYILAAIPETKNAHH